MAKNILIYLVIIYNLITLTNQQAKKLTDENFEHDTQATTGSTTGDWFLLFCSPKKVKQCSQEGVLDVWDELYGRLAGRASVAYLDIEQSRVTQKRFKVLHNDLPAIFYISKGKWYRYRVIRD